MGKVKDTVVFKGNEDGIVIIIDENAEYDEIKSLLTEKAESLNDFFNGSSVCINFKGKPLMSDEKEEFLHIISEKAGLTVSVIDDNSALKKNMEEEIQRAIEKRAAEKAAEKAIEQNMIDEAEKKVKDMLLDIKTVTKYYIGSLRSGMSIEYNGSVVVVGDINPGAEIRADGNVIVLGRLRGVVHAGRKGAADVFVASLCLRPKQLIIGNIITSFSGDANKEVKPEYAYIKDNMIYVDPL